MSVIKLSPCFKDYIWGGNILKDFYKADTLDRVSEAWILSTHKDGQSVCENGETFYDFLSKNKEFCGKNCENFKFFPQLIKLIDAKDDLSVQVHPSDDYALKHENQFGKTEMWYILSAEKGAGIYYGFKKAVTKDEIKSAIENNTVCDLLNFVPVKKGEFYFIPSGTLHAIGKGLLIAEIQQNSNLTYRVYDYGRVDKNGNKRELHIEKALKVLNPCPAENYKAEKREKLQCGEMQTLCKCNYFTVKKLNLNGEYNLFNQNSFTAVIVLDGEGFINGRKFAKFDTFFVPANENASITGNCLLLLSCV